MSMVEVQTLEPQAGAVPVDATARPSLVGMTRAELAAALGVIGVSNREIRMRVAQLWHWIYFQGATSFDAPSNISKALRSTLADHFTLARPQVAAEQVSSDGTRKWLIRLDPVDAKDRGAEIECVYIPESDRGTLCVSSQVGCTLTCAFCHTGTQRLVRNLTSREIVQQLVVARDRIGDFPGRTPPTDGLLPGEGSRAVSNVVFMGMGEPLYNLDNVRDAIEVLADGDGLSLIEAPDHRLDRRRRAADRAARHRGRHDAGDLATCGARRSAQ